MVYASVHSRIVIEVVVRDAAIRARGIGVDAATIVEAAALGRLHRVRDRVVLNLHATHVRALTPAPAQAKRLLSEKIDGSSQLVATVGFSYASME